MGSEFYFDREPVQALLIAQHRAQLDEQIACGLLTSTEAKLLSAAFVSGEALQRATDATLSMMREQVAERVH